MGPAEPDRDDPVQAHLLRTWALVDAHGWAVQNVPATDAKPGFAYTVGLWERHRAPEVLISGLEPHVAGGLCNLVAERAVERGPLPTGIPVEGVLTRLPVVLVPIRGAASHDDLVLLRALWPAARPEAVQLVWPDARGRFPWDDGCDRPIAAAQPLRGAPPGVIMED